MKKVIESKSLNIIGKKVKEARIAAKMSQAELSAKLELIPIYICRGSISRIENGERTINDIEIDALSKLLNVSLDYLFGRK